MALHVGESCTGSLELHGCSIESFRTLGGGNVRPPILDMQSTNISYMGVMSEELEDIDLSDCTSAISSDA
jgi:hypothetical protein